LDATRIVPSGFHALAKSKFNRQTLSKSANAQLHIPPIYPATISNNRARKENVDTTTSARKKVSQIMLPMPTKRRKPMRKPIHEPMSKNHSTELKSVTVFFDGAGCRPDGNGSGIAWIRPDTGQRHIERIDGLTNNQAEYKAFLSAVQSVPERSAVVMFSDSQLICSQFSGVFRVKDSTLQELLSQILALIVSKKLELELQWVPRSKNSAGKLL
jgi:ribonuclease HI